MRKGRRKKKSRVSYLVFFMLAVVVTSAVYLYDNTEVPRPPLVKIPKLERTWRNYKDDVVDLANDFDMPPEYFLALIVLECSGDKEKEIVPRFEKHVYKKLKNVRDKKSASYGSIKYNTIHDSSDDALKNLATSWGPFQLMGYQSIELDLNVSDIRGDRSLYWGMYWIKKRYGKYLRKKDFKNSFHIHNAGHRYPLVGGPNTHDPKYVPHGLSYVNYFKNRLAND